VVPSFKNRQSGYTRLIKKGKRLSDNAKMVVMEWVEREAVEVKPKSKKIKPRKALKKVTKTKASKTKVARKVKNAKSKK
jgi:hypothetical protein